MWNSLASYFTSGHCAKPQKENVGEIDKLESDWVFVDHSGQEILKDEVQNEENPTTDMCDSHVSHGSQHSPITFLDLSDISDSPHQTPSCSPCTLEDDWLITPLPCFTLNSAPDIKASPYENLLIEHPSMSVYNIIPGYSNKEKCAGKSPKLSCFISPERKHAEMFSKKQENKKKETKTRVSKEMLRDRAAYTKFLNQSKDKYEQIENIKPTQKAKWKNEQFKLSSSYMARQNIVRRYHLRNCDNQRKSYIVKPFGEKCKHGF